MDYRVFPATGDESGDFDASGPVTASAGKLEGATGNLTLTGT
jgi:hypothetical protein